MQKGYKVIRMVFFSLAQFSRVGHLESLTSLLYNTRGICSFYVCSIVFPFELQEVRAIFKCYWFKYLSTYLEIGKDEGKQNDRLFSPQRLN